MSRFSFRPRPSPQPDASRPRAGTDPVPEGRAARKRELTQRLFGCFLLAVERGETFEWRAFLDELESALWDEAMTLAGGNGREAAALVGIPYSTFMARFRLRRRDQGGPGPGPTAGI